MSERPKLENLNVLNNFLINAIANDPDVGEAFFSADAVHSAGHENRQSFGPCSAFFAR